MMLREEVERLSCLGFEDLQNDKNALDVFVSFKGLLNSGKLRAAEKKDETWMVNTWVKKGILLGFRLGTLMKFGDGEGIFFDKSTYPVKKLTRENNVRLVPGGSSVRDGSYLASHVVVMPPAYVNVGAYVDTGSMIDSHALVGSCAQVGKNVHLSAASQLGGVLEPIGAMPVIIEDHVMVGGNCGVYEGTIVKKNAVLGTGVILNAATPIYDIVNQRVIRKTDKSPLCVPEGAVVVSGSRKAKGSFAEREGLSVYTPVIVKYRDQKTSKSVSLEQALRHI